MRRSLPALCLAAVGLSLLSPVHALAPTTPNVIGVYEGYMRARRAKGLLTRTYPARLDIETQSGDDFTGRFSTTLGIGNEPVQGTVSTRRGIILQVLHFPPASNGVQPPPVLLMGIGGKLNPRLNHLTGQWQGNEIGDSHGPINLHRR